MDFLILALATFRISSLLADEDGPYNVLETFRQAVGVKRDDTGEQYALNKFADGLICIWCNSVWVGLGLTVAYMSVSKSMTILLCMPLAFSTIAIVIERIT